MRRICSNSSRAYAVALRSSQQPGAGVPDAIAGVGRRLATMQRLDRNLRRQPVVRFAQRLDRALFQVVRRPRHLFRPRTEKCQRRRSSAPRTDSRRARPAGRSARRHARAAASPAAESRTIAPPSAASTTVRRASGGRATAGQDGLSRQTPRCDRRRRHRAAGRRRRRPRPGASRQDCRVLCGKLRIVFHGSDVAAVGRRSLRAPRCNSRCRRRPAARVGRASGRD